MLNMSGSTSLLIPNYCRIDVTLTTGLADLTLIRTLLVSDARLLMNLDAVPTSFNYGDSSVRGSTLGSFRALWKLLTQRLIQHLLTMRFVN